TVTMGWLVERVPAIVLSHTIDVRIRVSRYEAVTDANRWIEVYYDYVIAVLQLVSGRESAWREASRKIERCKERAAVFGNRKFSYEWLGHGDGLDMLVHYSEVPDTWDRNHPGDVPLVLRRMPARIASIGSPQAGTLHLEAGGLEAFFVPARAGALRGRHENARAEAVVGFSYDGLRAWSVRLLPASTE
ncbi:MAG: hypothetical protein M3P85_00285, partial [Actinomycetota bacterium]|nr:hypothetical protein [Actinomycetota bacterium]